MKAPIILAVLLSACVPLKEFKQLESNLKVINDSNSRIKKEIRLVENANTILKDSLAMVKERAKLLSTQIEKRLAKKGIFVTLNSDDLKGLSIYNQDSNDPYYDDLRKQYDFKDTNSAVKTSWLTPKERELIYWLNFARLNPELFCKRYIVPLYLKEKDNAYIATLMDYMLHMKPVPALVPDKELFESAKCHAYSMGKAGLTGHGRIDGCKSKFSGECCSYGLSDPLSVVIQLLVDEHVTSLGHRYICLGSYVKIGVSFQPHKVWGNNVVLDFGRGTVW